MFRKIITKHFLSQLAPKVKKVLVCPDKFKFSLTSAEVSTIIKDSLPQDVECKILTLADGGEGSLDTIARSLRGSWVKCQVKDPLFRPIESEYFQTDLKEAFIEMARASGLSLVEENQRNPLKTSTIGTGQLIKNSLERGNRKINLLIGGSATTDGGIGCASALGFQFLDKQGKILKSIGQSLLQLDSIQQKSRKWEEQLRDTKLTIYSDVLNPLTGLNGAAHVYGAQKGATTQMIQELDQGLENLNKIFIQKYGIDANDIPGSGGAGGLGAGCFFLLQAQLLRGIDLIFKITEFQQHLSEADLVITGEGKFDGQTLEGKVVKGVIERCLQAKKPVIVLSAIVESAGAFPWSSQEVKVIQILKNEQKKVIDPKVTRLRLQQSIKRQFKYDQ